MDSKEKKQQLSIYHYVDAFQIIKQPRKPVAFSISGVLYWTVESPLAFEKHDVWCHATQLQVKVKSVCETARSV